MLENRCERPRVQGGFWLMIDWEIPMRRDDDYLRAMLLDLEAGDQWLFESRLWKNSPKDDVKRHHHILLAADAGLLFEMEPGVFRMSNDGHDFVAAIRQNETWEATKAAVKHLGGASLRIIYGIAEGYARKKLAELGVPLA